MDVSTRETWRVIKIKKWKKKEQKVNKLLGHKGKEKDKDRRDRLITMQSLDRDKGRERWKENKKTEQETKR